MARTAYLEHLASLPLLSGCSKKELQAVAQASDQVDLSAGRVLCQQGSVGREAFIILEGEATVSRNGRTVKKLGPGDAFGELALLDHGPRTATVTANTDLSVLVIGAREFASILDDVPPLARKLLRTLAGHIRALDAKAYG